MALVKAGVFYFIVLLHILLHPVSAINSIISFVSYNNGLLAYGSKKTRAQLYKLTVQAVFQDNPYYHLSNQAKSKNNDGEPIWPVDSEVPGQVPPHSCTYYHSE